MREGPDDIYDWPTDGIPSYAFFDDDTYIPDEYIEERWKPSEIPNVMVSNNGRFYNLKRGRFIKPTHGDGIGHKAIKVRFDNVQHQKYAHRLIANAFVENPNNLPYVRHLNDVPDDNEIENLKWGTHQDNMDDMWRNGHGYRITDEDREKYLSKQRKPVVALNEKTGEKLYFNSIKEAGNKLGVFSANIQKVIAGKRSRTGGYSFRLAEEGKDE